MSRAVLTLAVAFVLGVWTFRVIGNMLTGSLDSLEQAYIVFSLTGWNVYLVAWVGGGFEKNR